MAGLSEPDSGADRSPPTDPDGPTGLSDDEIKEQVRRDLVKLRDAVESETGRKSRWSGVVNIGVGANHAQAVFDTKYDIGIVPALVRRKARWRTLIHELVHSLSQPVTQEEIRSLKGWEEGPVEIIQRRIRAAVMAKHGAAYDEEHIRKVEGFWPFNAYVEAIEAICTTAGEDPFRFSLELLSLPVSQRPGLFLRRHTQLALENKGIQRQYGVLRSPVPEDIINPKQLSLMEAED
jgi:hypothetical protein